jgi:hypothetical protein
MSSSFFLEKLHAALAPIDGAGYFFVRFDVTDVNSNSKGANTKMYSFIHIELQFLVRPTRGPLILVLGTLVQHDHVIDVIGMQDSIFLFVLIVLPNQTLFTCADVFSVSL